MENFNEPPPKTLSFASIGCDVRTGAWEPYVAAAEADDVVFDCPKKAENHISCKNPDHKEFISDVGGLDFTVSLDQTALPKLPKFIPILEKSFLWSDPAAIPGDFVGVSLSDIFGSSLSQTAGRLQAPRFRLDQKLKLSPLFSQKNVILVMSAQDVLIENLWMQQRELDLFASLHEAGFRIATSPNFSVFAGECPLGHAINQKKSLICAELLQAACITPIPHLYSINHFHTKRYVQYLREHPSIRTVIINCTLQRKEPVEVQSVLRDIAYLLSQIEDLHIILQGLDVRDTRLFCEYDANLHYAVSTPFYNALFHKQNVYDAARGEMFVTRSPRTKFDLAHGNVLAHIEYLNNVCQLRS